MRLIGPYISLLVLLLGCGDREENEARLFLDRIVDVDPEDPVEDRRGKIDAVAALVLRNADLIRVRDTCVSGHRALLTAEDEQGRAAHSLAALSDGDPEAQLPEAEAQRIRAAIQTSNRELARARELLTHCQQDVQALEHRYAKRR